MNTKRRTAKIRSIMVTRARRWAKEINCPFYDGVGEIPESGSPYLIALSKDGMSAWRVRRKFVEAGVSDDPDALLDEALAGDWDDLEEAEGGAAADYDKATEDFEETDAWFEKPLMLFDLPMPETTPHGVKQGTASSAAGDRKLPLRKD